MKHLYVDAADALAQAPEAAPQSLSDETSAEDAEWLAEAQQLIRASEGHHLYAAVALADYVAASSVDLNLDEGEPVHLLDSAEAPLSWKIAQKRTAPYGRGLVPATYVQVLPFKARCLQSYYEPESGMRLNKGDLVEVQPEHSLEEDDDSWWAVPLSRAGPRAVSSGGGLVPKNKLEPLSDAEIQ